MTQHSLPIIERYYERRRKKNESDKTQRQTPGIFYKNDNIADYDFCIYLS